MARPTIQEVNEILNYLKSVDLRTVDYNEIRKHTDVLVRCGFLGASLQERSEDKPFSIFRGRVVNDIQEMYTKVSEISYPH